MMVAYDYTVQFKTRALERKRLTKMLQELVDRVANEISETAPDGTRVNVEGVGRLLVGYRDSTAGGETFLFVARGSDDPHDEEYDYGGTWDGCAFGTGREPGSSFFLHGDFNKSICVPSTAAYLDFANNIERVVAAFEGIEGRVIEALADALVHMREVAGKAANRPEA